MERLTTCKEITKETDMTNEWGYSHIYKRLAAYESTNLTPEEVKELAQAKTEGRLVVLNNCDECYYKINSNAWRFYVYPCADCQRRTRNNYRPAEEAEAALLKEKENK